MWFLIPWTLEASFDHLCLFLRVCPIWWRAHYLDQSYYFSWSWAWSECRSSVICCLTSLLHCLCLSLLIFPCLSTFFSFLPQTLYFFDMAHKLWCDPVVGSQSAIFVPFVLKAFKPGLLYQIHRWVKFTHESNVWIWLSCESNLQIPDLWVPLTHCNQIQNVYLGT